MPSYFSEEGSVLSTLETAKAFNSFFSSVFTDEMPLTNMLISSTSAKMDTFIVTSEGVANAIDRLPTNSSPGPDGISTKLLKSTKDISSKLLGALFQKSRFTGTLPENWKLAHVIPIYKSGNRNSLTNYRLISLTCVSCKLLEHIIYSQTMKYLMTNNPFFSNQHGFQQGRRGTFRCS